MCVVTGEREALSAAVAGGCKRVLVDLQDSEHVDPLVLGAILGAHRRLSHFGGEMAVLCASESGYADLERVGITRQMTTFEERQDASDWLGQELKEIPGNAR